MEFLHRIYYGNSVEEYLVAAGIVLAVVVAAHLLRMILRRKLEAAAAKTETRIDDLMVDMLERTRLLAVLVVALYLGAMVLVLPVKVGAGVRIAAVIAMLFQFGIWVGGAIRFLVADYRKGKEAEGDTSSLGTILVLSVVARMVLWVIVVLLILDNVGIDVTALVAGLGIGGVAVALALQNILGDLFASVSIMLDKPFVVGDFLIVGDEMGTVENIGVKTTRVRALSGEQLVFANGDLLGARIRNFKRMQERRVVFTIGVTYQTPIERVEELPGLLGDIVEAVEGVRLDRSHFKGFGDSALLYEVVYYVKVPDYVTYMDAQQRMNFAILRALAERDIEIAYPTRTLFVNRSDPPPASP